MRPRLSAYDLQHDPEEALAIPRLGGAACGGVSRATGSLVWGYQLAATPLLARLPAPHPLSHVFILSDQAGQTGPHARTTLIPCSRYVRAEDLRPGRALKAQLIQLAIRRLGTCWKSRRFAERRSASWMRAIAAILRSIVPMRMCCARKPWNSLAACSSNGTTCQRAKKSNSRSNSWYAGTCRRTSSERLIKANHPAFAPQQS